MINGLFRRIGTQGFVKSKQPYLLYVLLNRPSGWSHDSNCDALERRACTAVGLPLELSITRASVLIFPYVCF